MERGRGGEEDANCCYSGSLSLPVVRPRGTSDEVSQAKVSYQYTPHTHTHALSFCLSRSLSLPLSIPPPPLDFLPVHLPLSLSTSSSLQISISGGCDHKYYTGSEERTPFRQRQLHMSFHMNYRLVQGRHSDLVCSRAHGCLWPPKATSLPVCHVKLSASGNNIIHVKKTPTHTHTNKHVCPHS